MTRQQMLKLAYGQDESLRSKIVAQRMWADQLDEQIEAALKRIEIAKPGIDAHKWLADEVTDDADKIVSLTTVYDWLSRRNGRRPPAEVIAAIYRVDEVFAAWWNTTLGYEVPARLCLISLEQQNALLTQALREFGAVGEQKLRAIALAKPEGKP